MSTRASYDDRRTPRVRLLAFYLPQFHPTEENDAWWGPGFTEWRYVAAARPAFFGHGQPKIPGELGFYDLRVAETREAQSRLARGHGIEGFCVWHYWFHGKRLLSRPIDDILDDPGLQFPFCLAWANESWSRRWLGEERAVLQHQTYSREDDLAHARWLTSVFADPRYLGVEGRPLFAIYRPGDLPEPRRTCELIKETATGSGLDEPYLAAIDAHDVRTDFRRMGFDSILNFEPQLGHLPGALTDGFSGVRLLRNGLRGALTGHTKVYTDREARALFTRRRSSYFTHRCVMVSWDNTPRRGRDGVVFVRSTPETFGTALDEAIEHALASRKGAEQIVWINAWNEWAEGNYLEPDLHHGRGYLEEVARAASTPQSLNDHVRIPTQ